MLPFCKVEATRRGVKCARRAHPEQSEWAGVERSDVYYKDKKVIRLMMLAMNNSGKISLKKLLDPFGKKNERPGQRRVPLLVYI